MRTLGDTMFRFCARSYGAPGSVHTAFNVLRFALDGTGAINITATGSKSTGQSQALVADPATGKVTMLYASAHRRSWSQCYVVPATLLV
jgi:hypothetical protein